MKDTNLDKRTFFDDCLRRLEKGAQEYGDKSFYKPSNELLKEIEEELLDVANWSSILAATCQSASAIEFLTYLSRWAQMISNRLQLEVEKGSFDERSLSAPPDGDVMVDRATAFLSSALEKK